nr:MAG TPA: hypothetical protein [Caudoviricetes sp.]
MEGKEMFNEKEQELRDRINGSKYSDVAAWLARHDGQKLEAIIRDALAPESALYYQLMSNAPLFWTPVEAIGLDIEKAVETTFIRQLSAEKVASLATIMEENGMRIGIAEGVEITSNSDLLRRWNELHPDEKPMYKYSYAEGPAGEETIRVKINRGVMGKE